MKGITWINLILGIWLIISPYAMGTSAVNGVHTGNDIILGLLLIGFSWWILAAAMPPAGAAWLEIIFGIWLLIAPFVLRYSTVPGAAANDVISGIIAIVIGAAASRALTNTPRMA